MYYFTFIIGLISVVFFKENKKVFWVNFSLLLLMALFRYGVGADYFSYFYHYTRIDANVLVEIKKIAREEILFRVLASMFRTAGLKYEYFVAFLSVVNLTYVAKICLKYSKYPVMSLLSYYSFFYFVWTFSALRQGPVIAIGVYYLLQCLEEKKPLKITVISLVLALFHVSALYLIVGYFLVSFRVDKKQLLVTIALSISFSLIPYGLILRQFMHVDLVRRLSNYISSDYGFTSIIDFKSLARLAFLALIFYFYDTISEENEFNGKIARLFIFGMCLYLIIKFSELTAARLSIYGFYLLIILLPAIYERYKNAVNIQVIMMSVFILLSSLFLTKEIRTMNRQTGLNINGWYVPYTSLSEKGRRVFDNYHYTILVEEHHIKK